METGPSRDELPRSLKRKIEVLMHGPGEGFYRRTLERLRVTNGHSRLLLSAWFTNQQYKTMFQAMLQENLRLCNFCVQKYHDVHIRACWLAEPI